MAISVDNVENTRRTRDELEVGFTLIPDAGGKLLSLYNHRERYTGAAVHNPATYIVDREGTVRYAHFGKDAGDRPSAAQVYAELLEIQAQS